MGEKSYSGPIVAEGSYVRKSKSEIGEANRDSFAGKYGEVNP